MDCNEKNTNEFGKFKPIFLAIYKDLLFSEQSNSLGMVLAPTLLNTDTSTSHNASNSSTRSTCASADLSLDTQDEEILNILEQLQGSANQRVECTEQCRLTGNFVPDTVFNLSNKVLSDTEIRVLEKGLDFAPIQNKLNEPELRRDFKEFCRRMRLKWHFRNEPTPEFSDRPAFSPKSLWNPPTGYPNLEVFLSQIEHELFQIPDKCLPYSNISKDEWQAIRSLAEDRSNVIKKADKGSCVVIWDRLDCLSEAEKQLGDKNIYKNVSFNDKSLHLHMHVYLWTKLNQNF